MTHNFELFWSLVDITVCERNVINQKNSMSIVRLEIFRNRFGAISVITGLFKRAFQHKMNHAIVIDIFCIIAYAHDLLIFRMTMTSFLCQKMSIEKTLAISIVSSQTVIQLAYFQHMPCLHSNSGFV